MSETNLKDKTLNGVMWSAIDRFSSQGIQFIFNILIARILLPEDYGVVAMLGIFLAVAQTFIDSGFANALIRKNNRTDDDFSTVFFFNLGISILFYVILWILAPYIARFYNLPLLSRVLRIISITLVLNALGAVQGTKQLIDLDFRKKALVSVITIFSVGLVGLWAAYKGYGVWALVIQNIVGSCVRLVCLTIVVRWFPKLIFSVESFKEMFSFGSKLLATSLVDTIWGNIYSIVIGKCFSPSSLGYYNRAESFATFPSSNLYGLVQSVLYPTLCKIQDDLGRLKSAFSLFIRLTSYITFPLMIGLAAVADPLVRMILTDKWEMSVPLLQILCFALILYPMSAINITFPNIMGHSDYYLKSSLRNKVVDITVLLCSVPFGLKVMCVGKVVTSVINLVIDVYYTRKLIGYGILSQLKDVKVIAISSLFMGMVVYLTVIALPDIYAARLIVGVALGAIVYLMMSVLFMKTELNIVLSFVRSKIRR